MVRGTAASHLSAARKKTCRAGDAEEARLCESGLEFAPLVVRSVYERAIDRCVPAMQPASRLDAHLRRHVLRLLQPSRNLWQFTWLYPAVDLRDFPQPKIEVEDEEALDFLTGAWFDPSPKRQRAVAETGAGDVVVVVERRFIRGRSHLRRHVQRRPLGQSPSVRRKAKAGEGWDW